MAHPLQPPLKTTPAQSYTEVSAIAKKRRENALAAFSIAPAELPVSKTEHDVRDAVFSNPALSERERTIAKAEALEILGRVRRREWTAVDVMTAFVKAASIAQQVTNCLTETLFHEALARAKQLDDVYASTGKPVGRLHGLPVSLKDCFVTPPYPSSVGFSAWANEPTAAEDESTLVKLLRDHGAVVFCKTNIPTSMMMMETDNNVWGQTLNPSNLQCSAGGSSGGEAALLAMHGSPLGIGTDIGGSIRIPSAYNGLYSLKPSFARLPTYNTRSGIPGNDFVFSVNGPMSRSLQSLQLYCRVVLSDGPLAPWLQDPKCIPLPWRPEPHPQLAPPTRPLRLGFLPPHDEMATAHPPVARALAMARKACVAAGHDVLDWAPLGHDAVCRATIAGFLDLGGPAVGPLIEEQGREPWFQHMARYKEAYAALERGGGGLSAAELRDRNTYRNALQKAYLDRWMRGDGAGTGSSSGPPPDALIAPVSPWSAIKARSTNTPIEEGGCPPYFGYTSMWSLLDFPAATFPVTRARAAVDVPFREAHMMPFQPRSEFDSLIWKSYMPEVYEGTPVGLQAVGPRLQEEAVLRVVERVRWALEQNLQGQELGLLDGLPAGKAADWEGLDEL